MPADAEVPDDGRPKIVHDGLTAGAHALLTLSALAQHHDVFAQWLDSDEHIPYVVVECVIKPVDSKLAAEPEQHEQLPAAACHPRSRVHAAAATLLSALLQREHTAEAAVATPEARDASLCVLRRALAADPVAGCTAAAGEACISLVRFALAGGSSTLRQVCESGAVGDILRAALAQPWQPALRRNAPAALALITALLAAGCANEEEAEEAKKPEQE